MILENARHIGINCIERTQNGPISLPLAHEGVHMAHAKDRHFQLLWHRLFAGDVNGHPCEYAGWDYRKHPGKGPGITYCRSSISGPGLILENCMDDELAITETIFRKIEQRLNDMPQRIAAAVDMIRYSPEFRLSYCMSGCTTQEYLGTTEDVAMSVELTMLAARNPLGHMDMINRTHIAPSLRERIYVLQQEGFLHEADAQRLRDRSWREQQMDYARTRQ